jgi:ureidoglycolate hydrolase
MPTAEDPTFRYWSDLASYHIGGETEVGLCTVYLQDGRPVTWMERHERTPELLIPIDYPFILPVMAGQGGSETIEAFQVNVGEAVVIGQNVWHSACQPVDSEAANYFVIFRRGTPSEDVYKTDVADVRLA